MAKKAKRKPNGRAARATVDQVRDRERQDLQRAIRHQKKIRSLNRQLSTAIRSADRRCSSYTTYSSIIPSSCARSSRTAAAPARRRALRNALRAVTDPMVDAPGFARHRRLSGRDVRRHYLAVVDAGGVAMVTSVFSPQALEKAVADALPADARPGEHVIVGRSISTARRSSPASNSRTAGSSRASRITTGTATTRSARRCCSDGDQELDVFIVNGKNMTGSSTG
jgi:hypothetical protein